MIFEVDIKYPKKIALQHKELAFLPERRKIGSIGKLVTILQNLNKKIG